MKSEIAGFSQQASEAKPKQASPIKLWTRMDLEISRETRCEVFLVHLASEVISNLL